MIIQSNQVKKHPVKSILFFDDQRLSLRYNMRRRIGKPQLILESIYFDPNRNLHFSYPSVFQDESSGIWRMIYQGNNVPKKGEKRERVALVAESNDGVHWVPRDTTKELTINDRILPNQILPLRQFGEMSACYVDPLAERAERLKGLVVYPKNDDRGSFGTKLWTSPDGIHWNIKEGVEWQKEGTDPNTAVFWNEARKSYVLTSRPAMGDRRIALSETKEWEIFTERELALQADGLDSPLAELYGMPVIPYKGYYIGLLWVFHTSPEMDRYLPRKYLNGHVDCQLAYSLNGWHFQRGLRDPFIENGNPDEPTSGCVYPSSVVQKENGSIWIYAGACTLEHGHNVFGTGAIVAYQLRQDGFVFLESCGGKGLIRTRPLTVLEGDISLNVQANGGEARIQVVQFPQDGSISVEGRVLEGYSFEDCQPFSGDDVSWEPAWKEGKSIRELLGRKILLEIQIANGRLFSINGRFNFTHI